MKKKFIVIGVFLIFFLVLPPIFYFYKEYQKMYAEYQKTQAILGKSSAHLSERELNREIINKVSKLIELPSETPTIASITDKTKLQDTFFARSQNGDKVLIFQSSKKAIIYRESINKIIDVGAISIENRPSTLTPAPLPSPAPNAAAAAEAENPTP